MISAIKQTTQNHLPLRIDGAHVEAFPDNTISEQRKVTTYAKFVNNGIVTVIALGNGRKYAISDKSTKRIFAQPELIPIWEIRAGTHLDIPFSTTAPVRHFSKHSNIHPSKHHWYTKRYDEMNASNGSWREMEQPPYMRGIDFQHPELW